MLEFCNGKVRISYSIGGCGPSVVLIHPIGLDRTWWAPYIEAWESHYHLLAIDLRGHGASSKIEGEIELEDMSNDLADVITKEVIGSAHIIGVSMGGMVAQHFALSHHHLVRSLILCATAATVPDGFRNILKMRGKIAEERGMQSIIKTTIEGWFSPASQDSEMTSHCTEMLLHDDPHSWAACWEAISRLNTLPLLSKLICPTLVVACACDMRAPSSTAVQIVDAVRGSTLITIPDMYHMGVFETPAPFLLEFSRFLASQAK